MFSRWYWSLADLWWAECPRHFENFHKLHHHKHRHHKHHVVLFVNGVGTILTPGMETKLMLTVNLGHKVECDFTVLDQNGNPMLTPVALDAPAAWSNTTPATETIVASPDGTTCEGTTVAVGTDTISLAFAIGGVAFAASVDVVVAAAPQVPTSVVINATAN